MKLSPTMRRALRSIIAASHGRGRRGLLYVHLRRNNIGIRTAEALFRRGLVENRFTRFGTGYRYTVRSTPKGLTAYGAGPF